MSPSTPHSLSADACRAARAILRWSVADLVHAGAVSPNSVQKIEAGESVRQNTLDRIIQAFAVNGVEVLPGGAQRQVKG